jgi:hypothetical protein
MTMSATFPIVSGSPASAILQLSPLRPGVSGSARLATGEPVPIARLLARVLDQYSLAGLEEDDTPAALPRQSADSLLDLLA